MKKYPEYKQLDLPQINKEVLEYWKKNNIFSKSIEKRSSSKPFSFYEGPPSANGLPGIHHVISRTIKDAFCRFKTMKGFRVERKAGWDTHGLPVELSVEKDLNITKEDIGKKISVEKYNEQCRKNVMRYKSSWEDLTEKMGYWVDMTDPYITYDNKYIESVWWLLGELYKKNLLYKGYTIQPYSPKAGTGLSTHELNQPGCYRNVKDNSVVAQFKIKGQNLTFRKAHADVYFLAWTTTPWTLPSNCALAVGKDISYVLVNTINRYTHQLISVVLAKDLAHKYFKENENTFSKYKKGDKEIPFEIVLEFKGRDIEGIKYEQLLPYVKPDESEGEAFRVILGDFVSTEDGTGIVHTASVFGADDYRVCKENNVPPILIKSDKGELMPLVNKQGKFVKEITDFANQYVRSEFEEKSVSEKPDYLSTDVQIIIKLKKENKAFYSEKYEHSYPHCWRTDKPILYYPMDSWFIKTTEYKNRMVELNEKINWKPKSTGEGRFGNWLKNLVDWNLSRSRYWGIPLPVWHNEETKEQICVSSIEMLKNEIEKSIQKGFMKENPLKEFSPGNYTASNYNTFDIHRPYVDEIILSSPTGKPMYREKDLIDVWFDSGSMPYAQMHYPFENKDQIKRQFPADFIAEGVDQTRGWFFTLHAISTILFDSVAYKNVISNGLVLDKEGNKMSKRLGNAVDPFSILESYGSDATRWYMISNAQPWDNLKFDIEGLKEVQRKFFGTLYNTYSFFALYANIDNFSFDEEKIPLAERPEIDQWILSELNTLIEKVESNYNDYEPTLAAREIQKFVIDDLSNWYVRLTRRRFWKGEYGTDKIAAYQTLYTCLITISKIASPLAPFFMEKMYQDLNKTSKQEDAESVHLATFPESNKSEINKELQQKIRIARDITSIGLSLRKKEKIKVRQPLQKLIIPALSKQFSQSLLLVKELILSELNIKELEVIEKTSDILVKSLKPNYKILGPKYGNKLKALVNLINGFTPSEVLKMEQQKYLVKKMDGEDIKIIDEDVEVVTEDIPGWKVAQHNNLIVAIDLTVTESLKQEGIARELVNKIQKSRKDKNFEVTDKIKITIQNQEVLSDVITNNLSYICNETLAKELTTQDTISSNAETFLIDDIEVKIVIEKE